MPRWLRQHRSPWQVVAPGVEMRSFQALDSGGAAHVVAFRVAPDRVHVVTGASTTASGWRKRSSALVAVNGGFFDAAGRSLGVRIGAGKRLSRRHPADWGVFVVRNGRAQIVHTRDFTSRAGVSQAIQCGPRLVVNGRVIKLKEQWARRTALGVQRDGRVIIAI
ncbi:MAG TPA: phosphodiester glycosidase family protein, partial [Abditibacteriaceae bacterium]